MKSFKPPYAEKAETRLLQRQRHLRADAKANEEMQHTRAGRHARGYDTPWQKASRKFLKKHALCLCCRAVGQTEIATITDHVVPRRVDPTLFWRRDNWQPVCSSCHQIVKKRLERLYAAGRCDHEALRLDSEQARLIRQSVRRRPHRGRGSPDHDQMRDRGPMREL